MPMAVVGEIFPLAGTVMKHKSVTQILTSTPIYNYKMTTRTLKERNFENIEETDLT